MSTADHDPVRGDHAEPATAPDAGGGGFRRGLLVIVALGCLALGALGGIAISSALEDDASSEAALPAQQQRIARAAVDSITGSETTETTETTTTDTITTTESGAGGIGTTEAEPSATTIALVNRVPASDQPCKFLAIDGQEAGMVVCGTQNGVVSLYQKFESTSALRVAYADLLSPGITSGQTPTPCPNLVPSELALSRGGLTIGSLHCYELDGRQWIAWTNEPLNTLGFAAGADGMSAIALFEWWSATDRPILTDDEVAFYGRVPEGHRATCDFRFVSFSQVQAVPPPDQGSTALCFVPNPKSPDDVKANMGVVYSHHPSPAAMSTAYSAIRDRWGVTPNSGDCKVGQPGEGPWQQDDVTVGRYVCAVSQGAPAMAWTTDPVSILSLAVAGPGMTLADLWNWWADESGPVYRSG